MATVDETLQQLVVRRLRQLGAERGRDPLPLLEAYNSLSNAEAKVTYEVVRRVHTDGHTNIGERSIETLAAMLQVDPNEVRIAAGRRPALGRFELPPRADKLEPPQRKVILAVIDAILDAEEGRNQEHTDGTVLQFPPIDDYDEEAANRTVEPIGADRTDDQTDDQT